MLFIAGAETANHSSAMHWTQKLQNHVLWAVWWPFPISRE